MQELINAIGVNLSCPAALGRILSDAVENGAIGVHFDDLLRRTLAGDERHLGAANIRAMVLAQNDDFVLQIRRIGGAVDHMQKATGVDRFINTPGSRAISVIRAQCPVLVTRYRMPSGIDRAAFVADIPIERLADLPHDGAPLFEAPDDDVLTELHCPDGAAWMLRLSYRPFAIESWFFEKASLRSVFSGAVQAENSSLVTLCRVFGVERDRAALPYLRQLADHEAHFVRWAAIQAIGLVDSAEARRLLRASRDDPHPQIRAVSARILDRMEA